MSEQHRADAAQRIVDAAIERLTAGGAATVSVQDVATTAGVSKGLVHYHFGDKDTLIARVADVLARDLVQRERAAMSGATAQGAIDALWSGLEAELRLGHVRVLAELAHDRSPVVRAAIARAAALRREEATRTIDSLFRALGLSPRLPAPLLARAVVAFVDGLALEQATTDAEPRVAFDALWLAMLSLSE